MAQESTNTFSDGLISDLNPLTTPNTVLTDALNATLLTFNGNELVLQNDMGNAKIKIAPNAAESVKLENGFVPLGIKEHGGLLYIVSHNPKTGDTEIGSFPSPKPDKLTDISTTSVLNVSINMDDKGNIPNTITPVLNTNIKLSHTRFHPGDRFIVFLNFTNNLSAISSIYNSSRKFYKLKLLSIEKGVETDMTSTLVNQKKYISENTFENSNHWFVPGGYPSAETLTKYDLQSYVQIYKLRKSGQLYLRLETENIDDLRIRNTSSFLGNVLNTIDAPTLLKINSNIFSDIELTGNGVNSISELITAYNNGTVILTLKSANFIPKAGEKIKFSKGNQTSIYPVLQIKNENGVLDNNFYLNFNLYLKALSEIKVDTVEIKLQIVDLAGVVSDKYVTKTVTFSDFITNDYQLNNILLNVGQSNNVVVVYTVTCKNAYYGLDFKDFIITDILDLSVDPSQWANSENADYEFYDYDLFDYLTI